MTEYDWIISEKCVQNGTNMRSLPSRIFDVAVLWPWHVHNVLVDLDYRWFDGIWWIRLNTQPITGSSSPCFDIWHLKAQWSFQLCKWFTQWKSQHSPSRTTCLYGKGHMFDDQIQRHLKTAAFAILLVFWPAWWHPSATSLSFSYPLVCLCVCLTRCFHSENPVLEENNISGSQRRSTLSSKGQRFCKWILHMENPNFINLTSLTMDRSKHWTCIISKHRHCFWPVWNKGTYQTILLQCFCSKIHYSCLQSFDPTPLSHLENLFGVDWHLLELPQVKFAPIARTNLSWSNMIRT